MINNAFLSHPSVAQITGERHRSQAREIQISPEKSEVEARSSVGQVPKILPLNYTAVPTKKLALKGNPEGAEHAECFFPGSPLG